MGKLAYRQHELHTRRRPHQFNMATSLPPSSHPRPARAKRPITTYGRKTCIESLAAPAKTGSTLATEVNANGGGASSLRRAYHRDKKKDDVKFAASLLYFTYMKKHMVYT